MVHLAQALAAALEAQGLPVFAADRGATQSHPVALDAGDWGGGQAASRKLRRAGFLACGTGLPIPDIEGDMNGPRIGTPELVRRGVPPCRRARPRRADRRRPALERPRRGRLAHPRAAVPRHRPALRAQVTGA
jgi:hypothetical protein